VPGDKEGAPSTIRSMTARKIFADLLRSHREQNGWARAEAAKRLQLSESLLEKLERAERRPQRHHPRVFDEVFRTAKVFARVYEDVIAEPYPAWFGPRVVYENKATTITQFEYRAVPGLHQTRDYARATFRAGKPYATQEVIEKDVDARMERQDVLRRGDPPRVWTVIGEGGLRQVVGSVPVTVAQIDHLLEVSEGPNVVLQVLPFTATDAPCHNGPAALFEFEGEPSVAYLEGWSAGQVLDDPKDVAEISTALKMIMGCALSPTDTRACLAKIRGEMTS
jgi:transcriptional regulator with XRE-family HTH domain